MNLMLLENAFGIVSARSSLIPDPEIRSFLERTAPLNNATKLTKPLFVIQGMNDPIVPVSEAEQVLQAAKKNGVPAWYLIGQGRRSRILQESELRL